jgi:hypothetical protein
MRAVELRGFVLAVDAFKNKNLILEEDFDNALDHIIKANPDIELQSWEFGMDGFIVVEFTFNDLSNVYDAVARMQAALANIK